MLIYFFFNSNCANLVSILLTTMIGTGTIKGRDGCVTSRAALRARSARTAQVVWGVQGACPLAGLEGSALHLSERAGARGGAPAIQY